MPIRVLMGFDGSPAASAAIGVGATLFPGAQAWICNLWTPPFANEAMRRRLWTGTRNVNQFVDSIEREGQREAERTAAVGVTLARAAGWNAEPVAQRCYGGEGLELPQLAEKLDPDVIVVGSRGLSGAQAFLGSVSDMVVHYALRPVVAVPHPLFTAEYAALAGGPVLVGWDGSPGAQTALAAAERLFPGRDLRPVLVSDGMVDEAAAPPPAGLVRVNAGGGSSGRAVADALAVAARAAEAALLVVGSRGRSAVAEILLGSVAMATLHHAYRPVMVVPAAAEQPVREASSGPRR
jgi:nucleotide-binding universal stress UspA family protein